jgi:hypothetical protein
MRLVVGDVMAYTFRLATSGEGGVCGHVELEGKLKAALM